jgi:MFS family permease
MIFFPLADTRSIPLVALSLSGMMFLQGAYLGPQPAIFSELFPTAIRYSGASLSLTLGTILGGALAPFIATTLYGITGDSSLVTVYLTVLSLISWLCSLGLKETYRREL